jgi:hypothetical protein
MQNERDVYIGLFTTAWRIAREQLRQQASTMGELFAQAQAANAERPIPRPPPPVMTDKDWDDMADFFERNGRATGARDAYASAVVLFIDGVLKLLRRFYDRIPDVPKAFSVNVNGLTVFDIFRAIGNNVRHYEEWRAPTHLIPRAEQAYWAVTTIAVLVGREVPARDGLAVMAANWAWPVLHATGGGTFAGLLAKVRECSDELLHNVGREDDPLVLAEIAKE